MSHLLDAWFGQAPPPMDATALQHHLVEELERRGVSPVRFEAGSDGRSVWVGTNERRVFAALTRLAAEQDLQGIRARPVRLPSDRIGPRYRLLLEDS